jgi:predicted Zn finger-like uncharacterized protein
MIRPDLRIGSGPLIETEMRLTCPNCGAEYEAPRSMMPAGGRHVQCSACHTRWFARADSRPQLTEDQIIRKLESRGPNLRVVEEEPVAAAWDDDPEAGSVKVGRRQAPPSPAAPAGKPAPGQPEAEEFEWEVLETPVAPKPDRAPPLRAKEEERAPQASPAAEPRAPLPVAPALAPEPPAPAPPRLDLGDFTGEPPAERRERSSLFVRGFLFALAAFAVLLLCYLVAGPASENVPVLGPILGAYADGIDLLRERLAVAVPTDA